MPVCRFFLCKIFFATRTLLFVNNYRVQINKQIIKDFQDAYYKDFGEEISEEESAVIASSLLNLFQVIYRPVKKPP